MRVKKIMTGAMALVTGMTMFLASGTTSKAYYYNWHNEQIVGTVEEYEAIENDITKWKSGAATYRNQWMIAGTGVSLELTKGWHMKPGITQNSESHYIMSMREGGADWFTYYDASTKSYVCYSNAELQMILSNGFLTEFIQEFKDYGFLDQNYVQPAEIPNQDAPLANDDNLETAYKMYLKKSGLIAPSNVKNLLARTDTTLKNDCLPAATDVAVIPAGTPLKVLGRTPTSFYYIQLPDGSVGFVDAYYTIRPNPTAE